MIADDSPETGAALRRLDLHSFRLLEALADTGSLSAACERLNLALAAGSRRLAGLEAAIGVRLAERGRGGTRLTPAGEAALTRWRLTENGLRRLILEARDAADGAGGQLRLAATSSVVVQFLPALLPAFLAAHPAIRLDLRETTSREAGAALLRGEADLALMDRRHVPAGCEQRPWQEDRLCVLLPRGHPLLAGRPRALRFVDLLPHDVVGLEPGTALMAAMRTAAQDAGGELRLRVSVFSFAALTMMVGAGLGLALAPEGALRGQGAVPGVARVPLAEAWARREHAIVARRFSPLPAPGAAFVAWLEAAGRGLRHPRRKAAPNGN